MPPTTETLPAQDQTSAEAKVPAETLSDSNHPNPVLDSTTSLDEAENIPTSESASPVTTG